MKKFIHIQAAFIFLATVLVGCMRPVARLTYHQAVSCDRIIDAQAKAIPFDELSAKQTRAQDWIRQQYPGGDYYGVGDGPDHAWQYADRRYEASFDAARPWYSHLGYQLNPQPTIADVVKCFGDPAYYYIDTLQGDAGTMEVLYLWYPGLGYIFKYAGMVAPVFYADSPLGEVTIAKPAMMADLLRIDFAEWKATTLASKALKWPSPFSELRKVD